MSIYNPKRVYEGFFETYFIRPFIHHYSDFAGRESRPDCLYSLLAWLFVILGVAGIMMGQVGIIGPDGGIQATWWICGLWLAASIVPIAALLKRTANGAPQHTHRPRLLGIDILLGVSCLLFFLLGLLMMITTLHSGELNPNARVYDEPDSASLIDDYVSEEPIFTYQDITPAAEEVKDTLPLLDDSDIDNPYDAFDPAIATPDDPDLIAAPSDSIIF